MKILHLISSVDPKAGGVSQALRTIIQSLEAEGIENEVATLDDAKAEYLQKDSFKTHALGPGKSPWKYNATLLVWLNENMLKYDHLVVHGLWQYHTYAVHSAWRKHQGSRPNLYVMPHGMLDPYFQKAKGRKLKALRNWFFWKFTEHQIINDANGLLFTCETERDLSRTSFSPYRPRQEFVIGLGVDQPPVFRTEMKAAFEMVLGVKLAKYYLFVSRIDEKKGVDLLIRSYLELRAAGYALLPLVIAGPGLEGAYGKRMLELARPDPEIYFPGMLSGDAKWGAFYGSEVFILPSHQENFGIAVVEAMACGTPVLITDQVNIFKEIEEHQAGLAGTDTLKGVCKLIENWVTLPEESKAAYRSRARLAYEKIYTPAATAGKFLEVLNGRKR